VGRGGESTKFVERKSWCTPFLPIIRKKEKRKGKKNSASDVEKRESQHIFLKEKEKEKCPRLDGENGTD
jgi:hypothetical protein